MSPFSISFSDDRFELARVVVHVLEARAFRAFDADEHAADVGGGANSVGIERNVTTPTPIKHREHARRPATAGAIRPRRRRARRRREPLEETVDRGARSDCGASCSGSFDASIGVSVNATSAENSTDAASVKPNSRNSRPRSPGRNEIGTNTDDQRQRRRDDGEADLVRCRVTAATSGGSPSSVRR